MKLKKILIVYDHANTIMSLEYAFKKKNYQVLIARDEIEAIKIAKTQLPMLILLNFMTSKTNSYQILKEIKQLKKLSNIKTLLLLTKNKSIYVEKGIAMGADNYLLKPFSTKKLIEKAENMLDTIVS
ncbi:MAG: PleD family two-component system response regulator [Tenacibaculum sp.]